MNIASLILKLAGWTVDVTVPDYPKCVICVAPHTSNWDFVLGKLAYMSLGRKAGFLMKEAWFFFPLGLLFRAMGGIPVPKKGADLTDAIIEKFNSAKQMGLAVTPEGTRKLNAQWRKGFLYIAAGAKVPLLLAYIDYCNKKIAVTKEFRPTGNIEDDLNAVKIYYRREWAKYPDKFTNEEID